MKINLNCRVCGETVLGLGKSLSVLWDNDIRRNGDCSL